MSRHTPFQFDRPVFVKVDNIRLNGREYKRGQRVPWQEKMMKSDRIQKLYEMGFLYHNQDYETEQQVGDGLDTMSKEELNKIVDRINEVVKANTKNDNEFQKYKCKKSPSADRQCGIIRMWRRLNGQKFPVEA